MSFNLLKNKLHSIVADLKKTLISVNTESHFNVVKAKFIGPGGSFTIATRNIKKLSRTEKPLIGRLVNEIKVIVNSLLKEKIKIINSDKISKQFGPTVDPTLSCVYQYSGTYHPLTKIINKISKIFQKIGFVAIEGFEIDNEWHCFDALNTPIDHPARTEQDTYYLSSKINSSNTTEKITNQRYLLRPHTSNMQIHVMLNENPPIRVISPGRCFRKDTPDATHSANFHQVEGLYVSKNVTICELKTVVDYFIHNLFGKTIKTRFCPSFFPFTEPSFELELKSPNLGNLSNQWIEVLGCGMIDPEVFKNINYNTEVWSGYAFGIGIERIAMLMYGIDDIRHIYSNDLRLLKQF